MVIHSVKPTASFNPENFGWFGRRSFPFRIGFISAKHSGLEDCCGRFREGKIYGLESVYLSIIVSTVVKSLSSDHGFCIQSNLTMAILLMEEIQLTSRYGKYPIIYKVLYIPGGAGFLPSTVSTTKGGVDWTRIKCKSEAPQPSKTALSPQLGFYVL